MVILTSLSTTLMDILSPRLFVVGVGREQVVGIGHVFAAPALDEPVVSVSGCALLGVVGHERENLLVESAGFFLLSSDKSDIGFELFGLVQIEVWKLLPAFVL